jgi:hypothetical protein
MVLGVCGVAGLVFGGVLASCDAAAGADVHGVAGVAGVVRAGSPGVVAVVARRVGKGVRRHASDLYRAETRTSGRREATIPKCYQTLLHVINWCSDAALGALAQVTRRVSDGGGLTMGVSSGAFRGGDVDGGASAADGVEPFSETVVTGVVDPVVAEQPTCEFGLSPDAHTVTITRRRRVMSSAGARVGGNPTRTPRWSLAVGDSCDEGSFVQPPSSSRSLGSL